jgi:hypothetical protein
MSTKIDFNLSPLEGDDDIDSSLSSDNIQNEIIVKQSAREVESISSQLEKEKLKNIKYDTKLKDKKIEELKQANGLRKDFAYFSMGFVALSTIFIFGTLWCSHQSDAVLITLLTTFTAQILGVIGFVLTYLFKNTHH